MRQMSLIRREFFIAVLIIFSSVGVGFAKGTKGSPEYLSPDGKIIQEFWNARPNIYPKTVGLGDKNVFYEKDILRTINSTISVYKTQFGTQDWLVSENNLKKVLNVINDPSQVIGIKPVDQRFYLLFFATNYYLVDKKTDTAYLLRESEYGFFRDEIIGVERITNDYGYGGPPKDAWRFLYRCHGVNGRFAGEPCASVFDIDCGEKKFIGFFNGSFCEDLDHDGRSELIVRDEVYWNMNWYWVYCWKNGFWYDSSAKFPNYYKTVVKTYLDSLFALYVKGGTSQKKDKPMKLLEALIQAARNGGACCQ